MLEDMTKGKNEEQILNIRMHQLALAKVIIFKFLNNKSKIKKKKKKNLKILVFTHGKDQFVLIKAHTNLGFLLKIVKIVNQIISFREAYLNYKCNEQAIDHLTIALKKNGKLFKENNSYHTHILTLLGKYLFKYLKMHFFFHFKELIWRSEAMKMLWVCFT